MPYRPHLPPQGLLLGYDPVRDLPPNHLARLVEYVVEDTVRPALRPAGPGQPPFDPRLCLKVLLYGYATGTRSSRRLELLCRESLPFLFLTRGDTPCYHTLSTARRQLGPELEAVWEGLFAVADQLGLRRLGQIVVDSSRWRANAGREATVSAAELPDVLEVLRGILQEAEAADRAEEAGPRNDPELERPLEPDQLREILRGVRKARRARDRAAAAPIRAAVEEDPPGSDPPGTDALGGPAGSDPPPASPPPASGLEARRFRCTPTMLARLAQLIQLLEQARGAAVNRINLTDPEAVYMRLGGGKKLDLGHSFEAAADQGLLVVAQRGEGVSDNSRLEPILAAAPASGPPLTHVTADSGYYQGEPIGKLLQQGLDVCIPDSNTASDLHRDQPIGTTRDGQRGDWAYLEWDEAAQVFRCRNGNTLRVHQVRREHGQQWTVYRAQAPCLGCPYAAACLQREDARYRTVRRGEYHAELEAARLRFGEPEHQARYRRRGPAIETVFAFLEQVLGYRRWWLRGQTAVAAEARWLGLAYQVRKIHPRWAA